MGASLLLPSFLFLTTLLSSSHAQQPLYTWCFFDGNANYTASSTYEANFNTLLNNLSSSTSSSSGFLTSSSGSVPDRVYGLTLCRGDTDSSTCRSCLDNASTDLPQSCAYNKNAAAWYDGCFLRYANKRFAASADYGNRVFMKNSKNISFPDAAQFNNSVLAVLRGLQSYAVTNATGPQLFATGEMDIGGLGGYEKVYGLVQCTRDITGEDCGTCLEEIFKDLPSCCPNSIGGRVLAASCNFRYEVNLFYNWSRRIVFPRLILPPTSLSPSLSPTPAPVQSSSAPPHPPSDKTLPVLYGLGDEEADWDWFGC